MKSIHNMDFIDVFVFAGDAMHHDTPPCGMPWNEHKCERVDLAGSYRFVFAFENVEESHYVTEKVE